MEIIERYYKQKAKDKAILAKVGNSFAVEFSKYDQETGEAADPEVVAIGLKEVNKVIDELQLKVINAKAMKAEMVALGGVV